VMHNLGFAPRSPSPKPNILAIKLQLVPEVGVVRFCIGMS